MNTIQLPDIMRRCTTHANQAIKSRQQDRDEIHRLTQDYLQRGGKIKTFNNVNQCMGISVPAHVDTQLPESKKPKDKPTPNDIGKSYLTSKQAASFLGKPHPTFCKDVRDNRYGLRVAGRWGSANLFKRSDLERVLKKIAKEKK